MKKTISDKIVFLNYVLACLIVILHADNRATPDFANIMLPKTYVRIYEIFHYFAIMAVPTFFALSGYLLFRGMSKESLKRKIWGRVRTVLVPYLFWNIFFYVVYACINFIPGVGEQINFNIPAFSFRVLLFDNTANPPLWFLPKLFLFQLCSPIVFLLFQKFRRFNIIWLLGVAVCDICLQFGYSSVVHWVPIFYGAGYLGMLCTEEIEEEKHIITGYPITQICIAFGLGVVQLLVSRVQWILAPLFVWAVMSIIKRIPIKNWMKNSFFIFVTHYFTILVIRKAIVIAFGASVASEIFSYFASFVLAIIILTLAASIIKKLIPKAYGIIMGGR